MSAFVPKRFQELAASLIERVRVTTTRITDFNVGSVVRSLLEVIAQELEELYYSFAQGVREAIPVAIYGAFDFPAIGAVAAYGELEYSVLEPATSYITIPAGTRASTATGVTFETLQSAVIGTGQLSVRVPVRCTQVGAVGNVSAGTVTEHELASVSVTNINAFTTGREPESDADRQERFAAFIASIGRATPQSIAYGASTAQILDGTGRVLEYVGSARVVERFIEDPAQPAGIADVVISGGRGAASAALVAEAQRIVDGYTRKDGAEVVGYKAAGVIARVRSAIEVQVDLAAAVLLENGQTLAVVETVLRDYLSSLPVGAHVYRAELIAHAMAVEGVVNITLTTPEADVIVDPDHTVEAGDVVLSALP